MPNTQVLIYKKMNPKPSDIPTYSGPVYVESIYVKREDVISTKYDSITNKGSKNFIGLIIFIICSIFSILVLITGIITKVKLCPNNMIISPKIIMILIALSIIISSVSAIYNGFILTVKRKVLAYYLENEFVPTTDKIVPVIANIEETLPDTRNKIFIGLSTIYIILLSIMFYL